MVCFAALPSKPFAIPVIDPTLRLAGQFSDRAGCDPARVGSQRACSRRWCDATTAALAASLAGWLGGWVAALLRWVAHCCKLQAAGAAGAEMAGWLPGWVAGWLLGRCQHPSSCPRWASARAGCCCCWLATLGPQYTSYLSSFALNAENPTSTAASNLFLTSTSLALRLHKHRPKFHSIQHLAIWELTTCCRAGGRRCTLPLAWRNGSLSLMFLRFERGCRQGSSFSAQPRQRLPQQW